MKMAKKKYFISSLKCKISFHKRDKKFIFRKLDVQHFLIAWQIFMLEILLLNKNNCKYIHWKNKIK